MCGIVGIVNGGKVAEGLMAGLRNLEYRGYDSVGIATLGQSGLQRCRARGKIASLRDQYAVAPIDGPTGIGHTRWATHGAPTEGNAHPHVADGIAVVHNGIIENYKELRQELAEAGATFASETDSEVVPVLISRFRRAGLDPVQAVRATVNRLDGQYSLAILMEDRPGQAFVTRHESPLTVGMNHKESLIASDLLAFAGRAEMEMTIENGDIAVLTSRTAEVFDKGDVPIMRPVRDCRSTQVLVEKGNHDHFMHKEIFEQPRVLEDSLPLLRENTLPELPEALVKADRLTAIACGTSFYAGMVARDWFERYAGVSFHTEVASEFRYRERPVGKGEGAIFISQSGETADTLACLRMVKDFGAPVSAVVNVTTSAMAREADFVIQTNAGPEIGVASTKAFSAQLAALLSVALSIGLRKGILSSADLDRIREEIRAVIPAVNAVLDAEKSFKKIARKIKSANSAVFVGRGSGHALAMEGALKLKEISYIHAEGFAAGELKHGPIALIDENVPAVVVAPSNALYAKTLSNAQEIAARDGQLVVLSDAQGCAYMKDDAMAVIEMPNTTGISEPFAYAVGLQLIAYHTAVAKGTDVDQPRNLAKSVTVE